MSFEHEIHRKTHQRVAEYLNEFFESPFHDEDSGHFYVRYGSTVLEISIVPHGDEDAAVQLTAYCVQGVELADDLLIGLLELNHQLPFGSFSVIERDVYFSYALFGRDLEPRTLLAAVEAVATTSDEYDGRIVNKYGGQTALDRMRSKGGAQSDSKDTSTDSTSS